MNEKKTYNIIQSPYIRNRVDLDDGAIDHFHLVNNPDKPSEGIWDIKATHYLHKEPEYRAWFLPCCGGWLHSIGELIRITDKPCLPFTLEEQRFYLKNWWYNNDF